MGALDQYCAFCGQAASAAFTGRRGADPYLLLMTANVLRLRRKWDLAEAKCSEVLRLYPDNAGACSVMGDILRDQGRDKDAIEWYKMAVDRDPANEADRKKLETLIDRRFSGQSERRLKPSLSVVKRWARVARDEVQAARPICPWAMVTAAIFAITLLAAFTLVLVGKRTGSPPGTPAAGAGSPFVMETGRSESGTNSPVAPQPAEITGDIPALELSIFEELEHKAAALDPNCQVHTVRVDPKQAVAEVECSMPAYWSPVAARNGMARMAATLAIVAATCEARLASVSVRCYGRQSTGPDQLAMIASGAAGGLRACDDTNLPEPPQRVFRSVWWSQEIAPENDARAFTPPLGEGRSGGLRGE